MTEADPMFDHEWTIRIRPASHLPPARILVMIHGWTGDERSMEIFSRGLPDNYLILFPRGPIEAEGGGYGWVNRPEGAGYSHFLDFVPVAQKLSAEIDRLLAEMGVDHPDLHLAGFSQGAALVYAITLLIPQRIARAAALAGFLPSLPLPFTPHHLQGKPIFIAHGTRDETIPVEKAREAALFLNTAGAQVNFCESSSGHKLAVTCFNQLATFLTD